VDEKVNGGNAQGKEDVHAEALFPTTREGNGEQFTVASFSEEEAAAYAPLIKDFEQIIMGIEMREEIEDQSVLRSGEDQ
jgi:hypothetical protein